MAWTCIGKNIINNFANFIYIHRKLLACVQQDCSLVITDFVPKMRSESTVFSWMKIH